MIKAQNNLCAACGDVLNEQVDSLRPCVDHDHDTNQIRGILCNSCNKALGILKDSSERIKGLLIYNEFWIKQKKELSNV